MKVILRATTPAITLHKQEMFRYHIVSKISLPAHKLPPRANLRSLRAERTAASGYDPCCRILHYKP